MIWKALLSTDWLQSWQESYSSKACDWNFHGKYPISSLPSMCIKSKWRSDASSSFYDILEGGKFVDIRTKLHASHMSNNFLYIFISYRDNSTVKFCCKHALQVLENALAGDLEIYLYQMTPGCKIVDLSAGHWRCIHRTNKKLLKPLYILLYYRRRRMSTPKVGGETWWCVCRHFLWRILGIHIPTSHEMWRETLNPHINTVTSNSYLQTFFVSSLFHDGYFTS